MFKMLEKLVYAGVGAMAITEEKARDLVSELEKRGHLSSDEASKLVQDLVDRGRAASDEMRNTIREEVRKAMGRESMVSSEEFESLRREVHDLNVKMDLLLAQRKEGPAVL